MGLSINTFDLDLSMAERSSLKMVMDLNVGWATRSFSFLGFWTISMTRRFLTFSIVLPKKALFINLKISGISFSHLSAVFNVGFEPLFLCKAKYLMNLSKF